MRALAEIWSLISHANRYIEAQAPWKLAKEGKTAELQQSLVTLIEVLKIVSQSVWPFMPATGEAVWAQLGLPGKPCDTPLQKTAWGHFEKGGKIAKTGPLFPRIETAK